MPKVLLINQVQMFKCVYCNGLVMQGIQKVKCANCGTMFMSETNTNLCPACAEQSHSHKDEGSSMMSGCGCGHSH